MPSITTFVAQLPSPRISTRRAVDTFRRREQGRLRRHFRDVLHELDVAPVSGLTAEQRQRRARVIALLTTYRRTSRFPRNVDFAGQRMPYFVDGEGTRCAVAHLMEQSGAAPLMRRIASERNNAFVRELAPDRDVGAWLASVGLTLAEAARIQPSYCVQPARDCCEQTFGTMPGVAEGTAESVTSEGGATQVTVAVTQVHGSVEGVVDGRVTGTADSREDIAPGDPVLFVVRSHIDGDSEVVEVDAAGTIRTHCQVIAASPPPRMKKDTLIAMKSGTSCVDAIRDNEPEEWFESQGDCGGSEPDDGSGSGSGCGIGGLDGSAGTGVALAVFAAASLRARYRARRTRRGHHGAR